MDNPPTKVSMVESSDCFEGSKTPLPTSEPNSGSQTLQQISAQAGASSPETLADPLLDAFGDGTPAILTLEAHLY
ncbi:hypothetical protein Hamer_G000126 [Homarus americanus]|uniref:Uncharacterized protein n=1 Tax=Homarus americanus TaxID=6706 RepID=A0A8J5NCI3_HOMAM|nr:hypothetical protein Hamer_G000126 [Homarus americanus]